MPVSGRHHPDVAGVLGLFVNTIVLRVDTGGSSSFAELLDDLRARTRGAYAHQDLPFERLVEEINPQRGGDRHPLFQVMVALQVDGSGTASLGGVPLRAVPVEWGPARFDLGFTFAETGDDLVVRVEFNRSAYDDDGVIRLVRHLERLLAAAIADPTVPLTAGMLLEESERDQLLSPTGEVAPGGPFAGPVQDMVARQAAATPDAVAVEFEGNRLTYADLMARSDRLEPVPREPRGGSRHTRRRVPRAFTGPSRRLARGDAGRRGVRSTRSRGT